jgi:segregation and condensation protein A
LAHRVPITIRVDRFEGPLDLLLYLIQSHELDVSKISIARITDQYLAYVRLMQELNFDIASDFLLMAATLIQWKSKSLLPVEGDPNALAATEDDVLSPEELLRQLREHQRFLEAGRDLATLTMLGEDVFQRPNTRKPTEKVWKTMDVTALATTFQDLLVKERRRTTVLQKETVSLAEKIRDFAGRMEVGKLTGLRSLLRDTNSRPETVVSFLASLELGRLKKMRLFQEKAYEEIYVELLESIQGFDTSLASGFDSVEAAVAEGVAERVAERKHDAEVRAAAVADFDRAEDSGAVGGPSPDLAADLGGASSPDADFDRAENFGSDLGGAEDGLAGIGGASASDADLAGAQASRSDLDRAQASGSDLDRAEDESSDRDPAGAGVAGLDSGDDAKPDLASFGVERGPRLADLLSGSHDGSGEPSEPADERVASAGAAATDGGGHADRNSRDS